MMAEFKFDRFTIPGNTRTEKRVDKLLKGIKAINWRGQHKSWVEITYSKRTSKLALAIVSRILRMMTNG